MWLVEYIITDGQRFIHKNSGKYLPTFNVALAERFTKKQAEGICQNSLPKALKTVFYVQKCESTSHNIKPDIKPVVQADIDCTEKTMLSHTIQTWLQRLSSLNGLALEASRRKEELISQLSVADKELSDIMHYIEFTHLNAAQGYNAYKLTKECRIRRRAIKNELFVLNAILDRKIGENVASEITKMLEGMDGRLYTPRVLDELFDI